MTKKEKNRRHNSSLAAKRASSKYRRTPRGRRLNKLVRSRTREFIASLKSVPCADCGGTFDPVCMDFDIGRAR